MYSNHKINRHDGFSMIEMMIAMATMAIVTGAALALVSSSIKFSASTYNMTEAEQNLRTAHEIINRDLTTAGDGLKGINTIKVPLAFESNYLTKSPVIDTNDQNFPPFGLVTSDDNVPGTTAVPQSSPAVNVLDKSDRLTLLTRDPDFNAVPVLAGKISMSGSNTNVVVPDATIFQTGEIYAITAGSGLAFGVITSINNSTKTLVMADGDVYGLNKSGATSPLYAVVGLDDGVSSAASIIRLQIIHYYVNANNLLIRRVFGIKGPSGFGDSIIAEHVMNFQFRYLLNLRDANGFVPQPKTIFTTPEEQSAVREVETTIGVETLRALNDVSGPNKGKQVISSTTATTVRNLQFRRAL